MKKSVSPFHAWLATFFFNRDPLNPAADGRPLYAYLISEQEYRKLCCLFRQNPVVPHPTQQHYVPWAACYCLAVSETYRREYEGGEWSWAFFDQRLSLSGCFANFQHRYEVLREGLNYWKRDWQKHRGGDTQYLGTLFAEGGLPAKLLLAQDNSFGRVIAHGLAKYKESQKNYRPLEEYIAEKQDYLAQVFQGKAAARLFADTVHVLMDLTQCFDLEDQVNPAHFLDQKEVDWRHRFPFALPNKQADTLINCWLGNAAQEQKKAASLCFGCTHHISDTDFALFSRLTLPSRWQISVPGYSGKTFLQWQVFEGNAAVAGAGGTLFASLNDERNTLSFRLTEKPLQIKRQNTNQLLSVRFFADGLLLHTEWLLESSFADDAPWIFKQQQQDASWLLFSSNEYTRTHQDYLLRLPAGFVLQEPESLNPIHTENSGIRWFKHSGSLRAKDQDDRVMEIAYRTSVSQQVSLSGQILYGLRDKDGRLVYRGFPTLQTPVDLPCTHLRINGDVSQQICPDAYGTFTVAFYSGKTCLLRRKISVLPKLFKYNWQTAATASAPAELSILSNCLLNLALYGDGVTVEHIRQGHFVCRAADKHYPAAVELYVSSGNLPKLCLPLSLPYRGAQLHNENGALSGDQHHLLLSQLLGKRIAVSAPGQRDILLTYRLLPDNIERTAKIALPTDGQSAQIELYALKSTFTQLLACSQDQDAYIELFLEAGGTSLIKLMVSRYNGITFWNNHALQHGHLIESSDEKRQHFVIKKHIHDTSPCPHADIHIMRLDYPEQKAQKLEPCATLGKDRYTVLPEQYGEGLWLIYPGPESPVQFRPTIFENDTETFIPTTAHHSLHIAARNYHPQHNPLAISHIIAEMGQQPDHNGWCYFEQLKKHADNLPLSVFETWKALAQHKGALALAVLRLGLDGAFCERMRQELAVVWEWLPEKVWHSALELYRRYFHDQLTLAGIPADSVKLPDSMIPTNVLCHSPILQRYIFQGYLSKEDCAVVDQGVAEIFNGQYDSAYNTRYNAVRREHGNQLPQIFNTGLKQWLAIQPRNMANKIEKLSKVEVDCSIVWLPVFTACVKAGKAKPEDICPPEFSPARFADAFYQVYGLDPDWFDQTCAILTCYFLGDAE